MKTEKVEEEDKIEQIEKEHGGVLDKRPGESRELESFDLTIIMMGLRSTRQANSTANIFNLFYLGRLDVSVHQF